MILKTTMVGQLWTLAKEYFQPWKRTDSSLLQVMRLIINISTSSNFGWQISLVLNKWGIWIRWGWAFKWNLIKGSESLTKFNKKVGQRWVPFSLEMNLSHDDKQVSFFTTIWTALDRVSCQTLRHDPLSFPLLFLQTYY